MKFDLKIIHITKSIALITKQLNNSKLIQNTYTTYIPMASQPCIKKFTLPIEVADIGRLIGPKGSFLKKHVVSKSVSIYKSENDLDEQTKVPLKINISSEEGIVYATIKVDNDDLLDIAVKNLIKHSDIFMKKKENAGKPKVIKHIFKTKMEPHHIGKYVGSGGKNIKNVKALCEEKITGSKLEATSVRVNICDDRFLRKGSYNKLFQIKNDASTENQVLITVSCIYSGNPNDIFKAVKPIIIDSVVNLFPKEEQVSSVEVDFLEDTCEISLEVKEQASAFLDNMDAEPRYEPQSPTYEPPSPSA